MQINGLVLAHARTNLTFSLFKVKAVFMDIRDQGNGLRKVYVDGFICRQVLIVWIRDLDGAVLDTGPTARAIFLDNVPGLFVQGDLEVSCFSFYSANFCIGQNLYVGMPADLDQFRRENSHGAIIGGIGLVQLGHMSANGRRFLNQINLIARIGQIQSGLDTADPSTDNHHISEISVCEILR